MPGPGLVHASTCPDPTALERVILGGQGIVVDRCVTCRRWTDPDAPTQPPPSAVPAGSRWRCRDHPDEAVTSRGTGCPICTARQRAAHAAHLVKAAGRRARAATSQRTQP